MRRPRLQGIIARFDAGKAKGKTSAKRFAGDHAKTVELIAKRVKANPKAGYWIDNESVRVVRVMAMIAQAR